MESVLVLVLTSSKAKASGPKCYGPSTLIILKEQVSVHARHISVDNVVLHKGETLMRCNYFRIEVKRNH